MKKEVVPWVAWAIVAVATVAVVILKIAGSGEVTTSALVFGSIVTIVLPITLIAERRKKGQQD